MWEIFPFIANESAGVSCHDGLCLVDRLKASMPGATPEQLVRLDKPAQTVVFIVRENISIRRFASPVNGIDGIRTLITIVYPLFITHHFFTCSKSVRMEIAGKILS